MIGSDPAVRGGGFGQALMSAGAPSRCDAEHAPAYLESSKPDNACLHYGTIRVLEVTGEDRRCRTADIDHRWRQPCGKRAGPSGAAKDSRPPTFDP